MPVDVVTNLLEVEVDKVEKHRKFFSLYIWKDIGTCLTT